MKFATTQAGFHPVRHDRLLQEEVHDAYKAKGKLPEPTVCPQCQAVYHEGHWGWREIPENAHRETCPACHWIYDNFPAGFVALSGQFFQSHRTEIMALVRHEEQRARLTPPLQRIMGIELSLQPGREPAARALGALIFNRPQGIDGHSLAIPK